MFLSDAAVTRTFTSPGPEWGSGKSSKRGGLRSARSTAAFTGEFSSLVPIAFSAARGASAAAQRIVHRPRRDEENEAWCGSGSASATARHGFGADSRRGSKSCRGPGPRPDRFHFSISRRRVRDQRIQKLACRLSHAIDCQIEGCTVGFGRTCESAQLADELERGSADLLGGRRRAEVVEGPDVPTHIDSLVVVAHCVVSGDLHPGAAEASDHDEGDYHQGRTTRSCTIIISARRSALLLRAPAEAAAQPSNKNIACGGRSAQPPAAASAG